MMILATLAFSSQIFAAPVCTLDITKNNETVSKSFELVGYQHPEADIMGYNYTEDNGNYYLQVSNADGNYWGSLTVGTKTVSDFATDEAFSLELNNKGVNYLLTCPKFIF